VAITLTAIILAKTLASSLFNPLAPFLLVGLSTVSASSSLIPLWSTGTPRYDHGPYYGSSPSSPIPQIFKPSPLPHARRSAASSRSPIVPTIPRKAESDLISSSL